MWPRRCAPDCWSARENVRKIFNSCSVAGVAERFLYRLCKSDQREVFVLKGATLFLIWPGKLPRPTRDIDFLGYGSAQIGAVIESIRVVCSIEADDGILFDLAHISGEEIWEEAEYDGARVRVPASIDGARAQLQIDIGFGDAVDPAPVETKFPVMLKMESPRLRAYPPEVVIAEKLQAMVHLVIANSRMKDFFDIWILCHEQGFQMSRLRRAIAATFARRKTELPADRPALTDAYLKDKTKSGRIFATLAYPSEGWAMIKLPPDQQKLFVGADPAFIPVKGAWGLKGCTNVLLEKAKKTMVRSALAEAWQEASTKKAAASKKKKRSRAIQ
jgi:nucleotidyltransferase AbiEii toxin of type IV toxin-antitoxin system